MIRHYYALIDIDLNTGRFVIPLPSAHQDALFARGWRQLRDGYLETSRPEHLEGFEHLFSDDLKRQLGSFDRQLAEIDEKTWESIVPLGKKLLDHQKFTIQYALGAAEGDSTCIGDAPGAGKTAVNVVLRNYWRPKTWLIVCPSSVKYNWKKEIDIWGVGAPSSIVVCEHIDRESDMNEMRSYLTQDERFVAVINYDIMSAYEDVLKNGHVWDLVTFDESHRFINPMSARTLFALGRTAPGRLPKVPFEIDNGILFKNRLFTTATSMNRPIHLWPMIRACDPTGLGADYYAYGERYCFSGYSIKGTMEFRGKHHVEELGYLIGKKFFVRHDIDHLLPAYREESIIVAPSTAVADAEKEMFTELLSQLDAKDPNAAASIRRDLSSRATARGMAYNERIDDKSIHLYQDTFVEHAELLVGIPSVFQMMTKLRKVTGQAKIEPLIEHIKNTLEAAPDEPIVVMLHHKENVEAVRERFTELSRKVVGGVSAKKRQKIVEEFQAGDVQIFIGNIAAAGEGLTLTKSCRLIFGELDWNATSMWQALKRVHRITQFREVVIQYLLLDESLDAKLAASYVDKRGTINQLFSGAEIARLELLNGPTQGV